MSTPASLAALIACQLGGDLLHTAFGIPVPGPVLGIGLLLFGLITWARRTGSAPTGILDFVGVQDARARGLATGVAAHGIGTARMLSLDAEAGGFAGLGMELSGILVGVLVPIAVHHWVVR